MTNNARENDDRSARPAQEDDAPLTAFAVACARLAIRKPRSILCALCVAAAIAFFFIVCELEFPNVTPSAIPTSLDASPEAQEAVFSAQGEKRDAVLDALAFITREVEARPDVATIVPTEFDDASFPTKRLYLLSETELLDASNETALARALTAGRWNALTPEAFLARFELGVRSETPNDRGDAIEAALAYVDALDAALTSSETRSSALGASFLDRTKKNGLRASPSGDVSQGRVLVVTSRELEPKELATALNEIRDAAREAFPDATIQLSAQVAQDVAERATARLVASRVLIAAAVGLALGAWIVLGGFRRATLCCFLVAVLGVWFLAIAGLVVGAPSLASVASGCLWFATTVYWIVSYLTQFGSIRLTERSVGEATLATSRALGRSILLTSFLLATSSLAFLSTRASQGAEFAWTTALSIPLSALAILVALPAALQASDGSRPFQTRSTPLISDSVLDALRRERKLLVALGLILTTVAVCGFSQIRRVVDRTNAYVQTRNADSFDRLTPPLCVVSYVDSLDELQERRRRFDEEPTFQTDDIFAKFPSVSPEKQRAIELIQEALRPLRPELGETPIPDQAQLLDALTQLESAVAEEDCACVEPERRDALLTALQNAQRDVEAASEQDYRAKMDSFETQTAIDAVKRLFQLRSAATPVAPTIDDVSERIRAQYVDPDSGKIALRVYSTVDLGDFNALQAFVANARLIDPDATGSAVRTYDAILASRRAERRAIWAAFVVLVAFLATTLRTFDAIARALAPLAGTLALTFGLIGWFRLPFDRVDFVALAAVSGLALSFGVRGSARGSAGRVDATLATAFALAFAFAGLLTVAAPGWQAFGRVGVVATIAWALASATDAYFESNP